MLTEEERMESGSLLLQSILPSVMLCSHVRTYPPLNLIKVAFKKSDLKGE